MNKKVLLGFYKNSIESYINNLENFEKDNFEVHIFDNITEDILEEFNLENILFNTLGENYYENSINIISNIEELILNLYNKYTFNYNGFIFDNSVFIKETEVKIEKHKSYNYISNLYSMKEWDCNFEYSILKDTNIGCFNILGVKNFINSVKELFENRDDFSNYYESICNKAIKANEYIMALDEKHKQEIEKLFVNTFNSRDILYKIYMGSFLINTFKTKDYGDNLLNEVLESKEIDKNNKFFIMYQLISKGFTDIQISRSLDGNKMDKLYDDIFEDFKLAVGKFEFIPKENRNKALVVVFISQFLGMGHAPTKTVLDRCYVLTKYLNKRVIIINTRELITSKGTVPIYNSTYGNVIEEYGDFNNLKYKDIEIEYYQPKCTMPDENKCKTILNFISKEKPYLMFNIGGHSITADLASSIAPMASISTSGNFGISRTKGQFFLMGKKIMEEDYKYIEKKGYSKEALIDCPFTYDLKPQKNKYIREQFEIPKEKFIVALIGARLKQEINEDIISVLDKLCDNGFFVVTIGDYDLSNKVRKKYKNLASNYKPLGFQNDVLACVDLVNLYINPKRQGGGSSAVECMIKGKPALSLEYGDVSVLVHKDFLVNDYEAMINLSIKCKENSDFYNEMSGKAKLKAKDLMDTKKYFVKMYNDIMNSPIFR